MKPIRVLIVEDDPLVAEDIWGCLEAIGFEPAGICYSAESALESLDELQPEAALLDITLGGTMDGIELAENINQRHPMPFVFLTSHGDRNTLQRAKLTRPAGYLLKPFDEGDLMTSLEIALFNHQNSRAEKPGATLDSVNHQLPTPLTDREFEIVQLMRQGKSNRAIAEGVFLSVNTVKTHLSHIYAKLDAGNRTEALFRIDQLMR
jgi:DNA-binding NarL/FixJ family response regulator